MKQLRITLDQFKYISQIKLILLVLSLAFLICGYFWQPTTDNQQPTTNYFLLDASQSMLARDTEIGVSRFEAAKTTIQDMVNKNPGSSRGLSLFAGASQIVSPITHDTPSFLTLLAGTNNSVIQQQGSNILNALEDAVARFGTGGHHTSLILISDGGEKNITVSQELIDTYKHHKIHLYIIGVGSEQGGPIVLGTDVFGQEQYRIYQGTPVIVKRNETTLKDLARQLGAVYIPLEKAHTLSGITGTEHNHNHFRTLAYLCILSYLLIHYSKFRDNRQKWVAKNR